MKLGATPEARLTGGGEERCAEGRRWRVCVDVGESRPLYCRCSRLVKGEVGGRELG